MTADDAARFRRHALECRRVAEETSDASARQSLMDIAEVLEAEADEIDGDVNR